MENHLYSLWTNARCGFYHSGMTKSNFFIQDEGDAIKFKNGEVRIDRYKFTNEIIKHFKGYIRDLRNSDNSILRTNFKLFWEQVNSGKIY